LGLAASVAYLAVLGLGISAGVAGSESSGALRTAGALLAAAALAIIAARGAWAPLSALIVITGLVVGAVGALPAEAGTPLYLGCFVALLAVGSRLLPEVSHSVSLASLEDASSGLGRAPTIDVLGMRELVRARRTESPLTVCSVAVRYDDRRELTDVSRRLASAVRETDLVGYAGGGSFFVVFVETEGGEARAAWNRVCGAVGGPAAAVMSAGFASFPEDNPTWEGLTALARHRCEAAIAGPTHGASTPFPGKTVPSEA